MNSFHRIIRKWQRLIYRVWKTPAELKRLSRHDNKLEQAIARAIHATLAKSTSSEERVWIEQIETLRHHLNHSSEVLEEASLTNGKPMVRTVGEVSRVASKPSNWALLLFHLIRELHPDVVIEMGTCLGVSASYLGAAVKLNQHGSVVTLEGGSQRAQKAIENLKSLNLDNVRVVVGLFQNTLERVLAESAPVDFVFVDGHHDGPATIRYFEQLLPVLKPQAVIIFDDIVWSNDMLKCWKQISTHERVQTVIDMFKVGICVVNPDPGSPRKNYHIAID